MTERQIQILMDQGLPADYDKLTVMQRSAIMAIEELLCYLEATYGGEFVYDGYVAAQLMEQEHLIATTTVNGQTVTVTVYRSLENGQWVYSDDYQNYLAAPVYEAALIGYFDSVVDPQSYKIFTQVKWIDGQYAEEKVLQNVAATVAVYITDIACPDAKALAEGFAGWIKGQGLATACTLELCVVKAEDLDRVYGYNYVESMRADWVQTYVACVIDKTGGVSIS